MISTRQRGNGPFAEGGFSLVELLVVVIIIGLLAAIAIPRFLNQQNKAHDAEAKAAARSALVAMESYRMDNDGSYLGGDDLSKLNEIEPTLVDAPNLTFPSAATKSDYELQTKSDSAEPVIFNAKRVHDLLTRRCWLASNPAITGTGGCPDDGVW